MPSESQPYASESVRKARFVNGFTLHFTPDEVDLQLMWASPFDNVVQSRIVMSPKLAKALMLQLQNAVKNYESQNGEIKLPQQKQQKEKKPESMFG